MYKKFQKTNVKNILKNYINAINENIKYKWLKYNRNFNFINIINLLNNITNQIYSCSDSELEKGIWNIINNIKDDILNLKIEGYLICYKSINKSFKKIYIYCVLRLCHNIIIINECIKKKKKNIVVQMKMI